MGVCSSKNKKNDSNSSDLDSQQQQVEQKQASLNETVVAAAGTPPAEAIAVEEPVKIVEPAVSEVSNDVASSEPATPQPAAAGVADGMETPVSLGHLQATCRPQQTVL
jgi:uncharacterized membrane protein